MSKSYSAVDAMKDIEAEFKNGMHKGKIRHILDKYLAAQDELASEIGKVSEEQYKDKELHAVASKYGMTINQLVGFMNLCEQLNNEQLKDTGIVAVPFWFQEQYVQTKSLNESLLHETENLLATLKRVKSLEVDASDLVLPERTSIITGVTAPYIPGVTGARVGDEHLDPEHQYIDPRLSDPRYRK